MGYGAGTKGGPDEIGVGAPYKRTLAAPDGSPSAASSAASPGYHYTLGPPPSARTTPPAVVNQHAGRQALARRTTFVRPDFFILPSPPGRSRMIRTKMPCRSPRSRAPSRSRSRLPLGPPDRERERERARERGDGRGAHFALADRPRRAHNDGEPTPARTFPPSWT